MVYSLYCITSSRRERSTMSVQLHSTLSCHLTADSDIPEIPLPGSLGGPPAGSFTAAAAAARPTTTARQHI